MAGKKQAQPSTPAPRDRLPDSEKITINMGPIDLGHIDLLVGEGFFSNRTDLIRTAIRNQLAVHAEPIRQAIARRMLVLGVQDLGKRELEAAVASGTRLRLRVLGAVHIADDVSPKLARDAIESLKVLGALSASTEVKAALADRII